MLGNVLGPRMSTVVTYQINEFLLIYKETHFIYFFRNLIRKKC